MSKNNNTEKTLAELVNDEDLLAVPIMISRPYAIATSEEPEYGDPLKSNSEASVGFILTFNKKDYIKRSFTPEVAVDPKSNVPEHINPELFFLNGLIWKQVMADQVDLENGTVSDIFVRQAATLMPGMKIDTGIDGIDDQDELEKVRAVVLDAVKKIDNNYKAVAAAFPEEAAYVENIITNMDDATLAVCITHYLIKSEGVSPHSVFTSWFPVEGPLLICLSAKEDEFKAHTPLQRPFSAVSLPTSQNPGTIPPGVSVIPVGPNGKMDLRSIPKEVIDALRNIVKEADEEGL